jgi:hypothetical protein
MNERGRTGKATRWSFIGLLMSESLRAWGRSRLCYRVGLARAGAPAARAAPFRGGVLAHTHSHRAGPALALVAPHPHPPVWRA